VTKLMANFWFAHGFLAVFIQAVIAGALVLLGIAPWLAALIGAGAVILAYASRERAQAERVAGRNAPLWDWSGNPKAAKDIGVPAALTLGVTLAAFLVEQAAG
jgi:uncharacterized membrane protein YphA (DoxX/SURF4 family)